MDARTRRRFDELLESVLAELPPWVVALTDEVPLHVEDYPSRDLMKQLGVRRREQLCGLYTGIALTERSVMHSGTLPDVVTIYREGILASATGADGRIRTSRLLREIRTTVLHELGHHHGLDEDELRALGYG